MGIQPHMDGQLLVALAWNCGGGPALFSYTQTLLSSPSALYLITLGVWLPL